MKPRPPKITGRINLLLMTRPERTLAALIVLFALLASVVLIRHIHWTNIHAAVESGNLARTEAMLARRPGLIQATRDLGCVPLHTAAIMGNEDMVELLIAKGSPVNETDFNKNTTLHLAAGRGHAEVVRILLAKGADTAAKNCQLDLPLHIAADAGRVNVVRTLIEAGANVNAEDSMNRTPLKRATDRNRKEVADLLRKQGAKE